MNLEIDDLARATLSTFANAERYYPVLIPAMDRFQINENSLRQAGFLATLSVESSRLTAVEESLYYKDPERMAKIYSRIFKDAAAAEPYARNSAKMSELLYQGYHGRGLIQLTHKENYERYGNLLGYDYLRNPALLLQPKHAALTAAAYWSENQCNQAADRGDMRDITRRVNGKALMHLAERLALFEENLKWMTP